MKAIYQSLNRILENPFFLLIFPIIAIVFLLFYSFTTSPLYLNDGMDSAVFKTMGLAILQGKTPYTDIFDHKGPILYLINAFGQWIIPGRMGIFCLQVIGLSMALIFMYLTARLITNNLWAFVSVVVATYIYGGVIQEGNQCEEWMMYLFAIAIYFAMRYFTRESDSPHPLRYSLIYGLCFGLTFLIRPNDAVAQIGGIMVGVIVYLLYRKQYRNAIANILTFFGGFIIVLIPILIYFGIHHALGDLWYGLIGFNKEYSGGIINLLGACIATHKLALFLLFATLGLMAYNSQHKDTLFFIIPLCAFAIVLLGTSYFLHYYIVLVPIICLYLAFIALQKNHSVMILSILILCCTPTLESRPILKVARKTTTSRVFTDLRSQGRIAEFYAETDKLFSLIPQNERDEVWNYNLGWEGGNPDDKSTFSMLWHNGIVQTNLITYGASEELLRRDDLAAKRPLWVVVGHNSWDKENIQNDSILNALYIPIAQTDTTVCNVELWQLKQ